MLTVLRENGNYEPLTSEEIEKFEQENPELARLWQDQSALENLPLPQISTESGEPIYESWDAAAKRLM